MHVLLTGGTGFLGSAVRRRLAADHQLTIITRLPLPRRGENVDWVQQDLSELFEPTHLPSHIDGVLHRAQSHA